MHKVVIDEKTVSISRFGAREGWKLVRKLTSLFAPALAELTDDNYSGAIEKVMSKLPATAAILEKVFALYLKFKLLSTGTLTLGNK